MKCRAKKQRTAGENILQDRQVLGEIKILTFGFPIVLIPSVYLLLLKADDNITGAVNTTLTLLYGLIL